MQKHITNGKKETLEFLAREVVALKNEDIVSVVLSVRVKDKRSRSGIRLKSAVIGKDVSYSAIIGQLEIEKLHLFHTEAAYHMPHYG